MFLRLQTYDLNVTYKRRSEIYFADALSRAYTTQSVPVSSSQSALCHSVEVVDLTKYLQISSRCLKKIQEATNKDSTLQMLEQYISFQAGQMINSSATGDQIICKISR